MLIGTFMLLGLLAFLAQTKTDIFDFVKIISIT